MDGTRRPYKRSAGELHDAPTREQEYLLTIQDVAKMFNVPTSRVRFWIERKWLTVYKVPQRKSREPLPARASKSTVYFTKAECVAWGKKYFGLDPVHESETEQEES